MRVIICGSRDWTDEALIDLFIEGLHEIHGQFLTIVHGAARGADEIAGRLAEARGIPTEAFPADWTNLGKAAGHIRNKQMLDSGADVVVAFKDNFNHELDKGGTENMVKIAQDAGVSVRLVDHT